MSWREETMTTNCFTDGLVSRDDGQSVSNSENIKLRHYISLPKIKEEFLQCAEVISLA